MSKNDVVSNSNSARALRFHQYGQPDAVLQLDTVTVPEPGPGRIRIAVHACGLTPADWALCRGLFAGTLPRGVGIDVSGTVDAVGPGVMDVAIGDRVFGAADWAGQESAGAAGQAVMKYWAHVPQGLDMTLAAAMPMALETACRSLDQLQVKAGQTVMIHGAGSTIGFAAVQMALQRGATVVATAGPALAEQLRGFGAQVTAYGEGMVQRVAALCPGPVDLVLDTAPVGGALPDLIAIAGGKPQQVLTIADFAAAQALGARTSFEPGVKERFDVFAEYGKLAAEGRFTIPIAQCFALEQWREALAISLSNRAKGKLMLML